MRIDSRLTRLDDNRLRLENPYLLEPIIFANQSVPIDSAAVTELSELLELQETLQCFQTASPDSFAQPPEIKQIAITPDFHKARGIPVGTVMATSGFVVPQAIGNDINCGMRLHLTSLTGDQILSQLDQIETHCRHIYFEGGRNIPMTRQQREAMFREGLTGLVESTPKTLREGIWSLFHDGQVARQSDRIDQQGSLTARHIYGLDDYLGQADHLSRDSQIGSIGGGNHFVEIQRVEKILDGQTAHAWGLKPNMVTIMVHTGSLGVGHLSGGYFRDQIQQAYPSELRHPKNGIFILPLGERDQPRANRFWDSLHNAANFAFANRMFLALMALRGLQNVFGSRVDSELLYDAPHNFLWRQSAQEGDVIVHRKGACPARGFEQMQGSPFAHYGEPVLVPGSMGASSFVLVGQGNPASLSSASHGAGRSLSRGDALKGNDEQFRDFLKTFRVVTPVDFRRADIKGRMDIVNKKLEDIKQEAPHAYKGIGAIIQTLSDAQIARPVAELRPLLTVKG